MNSSPKVQNRNILVVDDEVDVLEFLKIYLESLGWNVTVVDSTAKAFAELEVNSYFMILTDIAMPEMDGYEFITMLQNKRIDSCLALMTGFGYNPNHTLVKINKDSKFPCLFKPFNRDKLSKTIQKAWETYNIDLPAQQPAEA
jgi:DNA-binding NtrC family response regulator